MLGLDVAVRPALRVQVHQRVDELLCDGTRDLLRQQAAMHLDESQQVLVRRIDDERALERCDGERVQAHDVDVRRDHAQGPHLVLRLLHRARRLMEDAQVEYLEHDPFAVSGPACTKDGAHHSLEQGTRAQLEDVLQFVRPDGRDRWRQLIAQLLCNLLSLL